MKTLTETQQRLGLVAVLAVLAAVAMSAMTSLSIDSLLRDLSCDDSFYYGAIARELATTGRSTFDGIHETNGYHPLWCWLEMPMFWWFEDAEAALRATRIFEVLLVFGAAGAWLTTWWRCGMHVAATAWLSVYFVLSRELFIGMDAGTSVLLLGLASWVAVRHLRSEGSRRASALVCGAVLALTPLARLDQLAFSATVTAWLLFIWWRRESTQRDRLEPLLLVVPQLVVLGTYFAANWWAFDSALPVSGLTKQLWSSNTPDAGFERFARRLTALLDERDVRDGIVFGLLAVVTIWVGSRWRPQLASAKPVVVGLLALATAKTLYYAATVEPVLASYSWYFTAGALTRYIAIALLIDLVLWALRGRAATFATLAVAIFSIVQLGRSLSKHGELTHRTKPDWEMLSHDGCEWLSENVPSDARVGSFDAGVFGYFATQPVTNLDGLVQSRAFLEARARYEPLTRFLDREGIDWIANVASSVDDLRAKGIRKEFAVVHEGPRQLCIDGVERSVFVLRRQ